MTWIILGAVTTLGLIAVCAVVVGTARRNRRLAAWARTVPTSTRQAEAMRALWAAGQTKTPPNVDPLDSLSEEDLAYVLNICGASFRPHGFGDASIARVASFRHFKGLGFNDRQTAVLVGMTINMVGRWNG